MDLSEIRDIVEECKEDLAREGTYEDMYHVIRRDLETLVKCLEPLLKVRKTLGNP